LQSISVFVGGDTHATEVLFDEKIAQSYDLWAETPQGRKAYGTTN